MLINNHEKTVYVSQVKLEVVLNLTRHLPKFQTFRAPWKIQVL